MQKSFEVLYRKESVILECHVYFGKNIFDFMININYYATYVSSWEEKTKGFDKGEGEKGQQEKQEGRGRRREKGEGGREGGGGEKEGEKKGKKK